MRREGRNRPAAAGLFGVSPAQKAGLNAAVGLKPAYYKIAATGIEGAQSFLLQTAITAIGPSPIHVEILGPTLGEKMATFIFLSGLLAFLMVVSISK